MRKLLTLAFLLLTGASFAQLTPEFEFQLYFEDAAGNKDTITLGYDPLATDTIDTDFGEVNILNQPWGDSLDVRISQIETQQFYTKKQITTFDCVPKKYKRHQINISTKYWPITVRWNDINNNCLKGSVFTSIHPGGWWDTGSYSDLSQQSLIWGGEKTFTPNVHSSGLGINTYGKITDDGDTISFFWVGLGDSTLLTMKTPIISSELVTIYPNPFVSEFFLPTNVSFSNIQLFDINGKKIAFEQAENRIYPLNCDSGIYFLSFEVNNKTYNYKIIKQ